MKTIIFKLEFVNFLIKKMINVTHKEVYSGPNIKLHSFDTTHIIELKKKKIIRIFSYGPYVFEQYR